MGFLTGFAFENLVAPVDVATFFDVNWDRAPLVETRKIPDFYQGLAELSEIDRLLVGGTAPIWLSNSIQDGQDPGGDTADQTDIDGALTRMEQGAAMVLRHAERRLPALGKICRTLHAELGYRCTAEIVVTMPGNKPLPASTVETGMFVLQIEGSRRWTLGASRAADAAPGDAGRQITMPSKRAEVDVKRGDLLYVPRGWPVQHFSTGEFSVQLCLRMHAHRWIDVVGRDEIGENQQVSGAMSELLPPRWIDMPVAKLAAELSRRWPQGGDSNAAHAAVEKMIEAEIRAFPVDMTGRLAAMLEPRNIAADTLFRARRDLLWAMMSSKNAVRLIAGPLTIDAPDRSAGALEFCLTKPRYNAAQVPGPLELAQRIALLDRLARNMLIERISR